MSVDRVLFILVPTVAFLCNLFLLLTFLTAKKNKQIYSFLLLQLTFTVWTAGSLFMRLQVFPGVHFWFDVSLAGILCTPIFIYIFLHHFTAQKGAFTPVVLSPGWIVVLILDFMDVFVQNPHVHLADDGVTQVFVSTNSWLVIIPFTYALITLLLAGKLVYRSIKYDGMPKRQFKPLLIGVAIMFFGMIADTLLVDFNVPIDTFACALNAVCWYYALYKRRLITPTHITSKSPTYLIAAILTTTVLAMSYSSIDRIYMSAFAEFESYKTIAFAVVFSFLTVIVYSIIRKLMNNLFIKGEVAREADLKEFSHTISRTLDAAEIVSIFKAFINEHFPGEVAYICVYDEQSDLYRLVDCTQMIKPMTFALLADNPMVEWLRCSNQSVLYKEFTHTRYYKSMWESEKRMLSDLGVNLIFPINADEKLVGITFFCDKTRNKEMGYGQRVFLESAVAILAIAFKNASLYTAMQNEARMDALTNLYNRRFFSEKIRQEFEIAKYESMTLVMFNLDDFSLYNELYGTSEGDLALRRFADVLCSVVGSRGTIARYAGKEFIVSLPLCDARTGQKITEDVRENFNRILATAGKRTKMFLTFSAGVCSYPSAASNLDELVTYVNMAVYSAKKNGKNRTVVYNPKQAVEDSKAEVQAAAKREIGENCAATIFALTAAIDAKDHYTFQHSNNVSEYATILAAAIPLDEEHIEIIRQAGLLHDIGKIGVPESILSKQGKLTDEEYEIMKQHAEGSIAMIKYLPSLDYVIPTAISHHERWDGKGYPRGLAGEEIPIGARCLCLADSFDAMVTQRPYKEPMTVEAALEEIRKNIGKQFEPELGNKFIELVQSGKIQVRL